MKLMLKDDPSLLPEDYNPHVQRIKGCFYFKRVDLPSRKYQNDVLFFAAWRLYILSGLMAFLAFGRGRWWI